VVCAIGTSEAHLAVGLGIAVRVLAECGVRPTAIVAAVSAQDAGGLRALAPIAPELIAAQLQSLSAVAIDAFVVGALADAASASVIARAIAARGVPVVYDPVAASSAGGAFADAASLRAVADEMSALGAVITPNLREAAVLTDRVVDSVETMIAAARELRARGARAVLVKGGHLASAPQDVLVCSDAEVHVFTRERFPHDMRATGCVLAAALAAALAHGMTVFTAVERARTFVYEKITRAQAFDGMRTAY
jgi:hydroxymethylpyrimidine/phosphomethylpyrimidine kinase